MLDDQKLHYTVHTDCNGVNFVLAKGSVLVEIIPV